MRVFVLCTGRSGSLSFIKACSHITNFSAGHESRARKPGDARYAYPDHHIEADNRLSWFPGMLDQRYGKDAFYVHLIRDKEATVRSYNRRWIRNGSLIKAYCEGILQIGIQHLNAQRRLQVIGDFYDQVNQNIVFFLKDKENQLTFHLENAREEFPQFWERIGAQGDLEKALAEFGVAHNLTKTRRLKTFRHEVRFTLLQWRRRIF